MNHQGIQTVDDKSPYFRERYGVFENSVLSALGQVLPRVV
jgi:hypothetical protein